MNSRKTKDTVQVRDIAELLAEPLHRHIFPEHLELVPQLSEVYELELAFCESKVLTDEEIILNGAYFARVGNTLTRHFLMCSGEPLRLPQHSSSRLRSFFTSNQFKTGYATHGLFPYRGKFHPQMIKGLINIMGLKPGDTLLDPMMGSGTALVEARLMGVKSIGLDVNPFCRLMTQVKLDALTMPLEPVRIALRNARFTFDHFTSMAVYPGRGAQQEPGVPRDLFSSLHPNGEKPERNETVSSTWCEIPEVHDFLLLAYLDSAGYAERSSRKPHCEQFKSVLERYLFVAEKIQRTLAGTEKELADARALEGDARCLPLDDATVDGIIFSPPYSFAIDYMENDASHLDFLGVNQSALRNKMIGLRGESLGEKFDLYKRDMDKVLSECARVLRPGRFCTIVVGTNSNQLGKILRLPPDKVPGLDEIFTDLGANHGLRLVRKISRQITGMANTMRTEFVVLLQRT